jgi:hypothetical protein
VTSTRQSFGMDPLPCSPGGPSTLQAEKQRRLRENKLSYYSPYDRQKEFHAAGAKFRERLLLAGNQTGKSLASAMELAMHLCGQYPDWWQGKRFDKAIRAWACGETLPDDELDAVIEFARRSLERRAIGASLQACFL